MSELMPRCIDPTWRVADAVLAYMALEIEDGEIVTHEMMSKLIGVPVATNGMDNYEASRYQFKRVERVEKLKAHLLQEKQIYLVSERGTGYIQVPPNEQARVACGVMVREVAKEMVKCDTALQHTRLSELNNQERARHTEAQNKVSSLQQAFRAGGRNILGKQ